MLTLRRSQERGHADHGWLQSFHSFSFADYHDPRHMGFGPLRVINEDWIAPGRGFDMHGHRNMEIVTYLLEGALEHRDSLGNGSVIRPGEVQQMSAGSGVRHSEFNPAADRSAHLLQIWIEPNVVDVAPRYQQKQFPAPSSRGCLALIASPDGADGSVEIFQDARLYAGRFDGDEEARLALVPGRRAYVHVARGSITVNGVRLATGDAARIEAETAVDLAAGEAAEVLVFDLP